MTVLVVDDDAAVRRLTSIILRCEGLETRTAEDGVQALQAVRQSCPDAIVLDLRMPGMDGRQFMRRLNRLHRRPPVLVLSAHGGEAAARELGAEGSLPKPFDPDELVDMVKGLLAA
jgi:CheY-like chemotaxis protein